MRTIIVTVCLLSLVSPLTAQDQSSRPTPGMADSPTIKVLKGLNVPAFEAEMQMFVQALGVNCGYCHVQRNFASDDNARKLTARRMIEMVQGINQQFFPDHKPGRDESTLGRVTCFTCHQGTATPKSSVGDFVR
jgi:hypothetical protein